MDLLDLILLPELVIGTLVGLAAAALIHWIAPKPEPMLVEAGLAALGFAGGLIALFFKQDGREPNDQ